MPHSPISPRWAKAVVMMASDAIKRMSHDSTSGTPMPATAPLIAAITGLSNDRK